MSSVTHHNAPLEPASAAPQGSARQRPAAVSWLRRAAPTAAVVACLAALAFWGHSTGWSLPKFSTLVNGTPSAKEAWCESHNVAESQCIECDPKLLPPQQNFGWCKTHGVAQCPLEHPEVAQLKTTPAITPEMLDRAARALALKSRPENNSHCALHQRRVQFASVDAINKAGVDISVVEEHPIVEAIVANGEVTYDQNRLAHLSSRVAGTVWRVEKQVGDAVRKGDVLAIIEAADVGRAKSDLLQNLTQLRLQEANLARLKPLAEDGTIAGKILREAETAFEEARIRVQSAQQALVNLGLVVRVDEFAGMPMEEIGKRIHFLGLPEELASKLDPATTTSNLIPLRSPLDGMVVEREVVEGEVVAPAKLLFDVTDLARMWLTLNVRQEDARFLQLGQNVLFRASDSDEDDVRGKLSWISTSADEATRTVKVRVDLPNEDGKLRANTFGSGRIVLREEPKAVVIPKQAIHRDGTCNIVFVRDKNYHQNGSPKFFHVRSVRLGTTSGDTTEVIAGLLPGEVIASTNSVVLEAALLKSNLGAGCCEAHMTKK